MKTGHREGTARGSRPLFWLALVLVLLELPHCLGAERSEAIALAQDLIPPTLVEARGHQSMKGVLVRFSEPVTQTSAESPANYLLDDGNTAPVNPVTAKLDPQGISVFLTFASPLIENGFYTLVVNNVQDRDVPANTINPDSSITFLAWAFAPGYVLREVYTNLFGPGGAISQNLSDFTNQTKYASFPDLLDYSPTLNTTPRCCIDSGRDNYGERISGFFIPPIDGSYTFFLLNDGQGEFRLSSDASPDHAVSVLNRSCCTLPPFSPGASAIVPNLVAGNRYYFEALVKAGTGADGLDIAVREPGNSTPTANLNPIPSAYLGTFSDPTGVGVTISADPVDASVVAGQHGIFTVAATGTPASYPVRYQWQASLDGGNSWTNIPGATGTSYTTRAVEAGDDQTYFRAIVSLLSATPASAVAILRVLPDSLPPTVASTYSLEGNSIKVIWNEPMDPNTANLAASYHVTGATVNSALLVADSRGESNTVILTVSGLSSSTFEVGVPGGVFDRHGNLQSGDPLATGHVFAQGTGLVDDGNVGSPGDPIEPGSTSVGINRLQLVAGGSDISGVADAFRYAYGSYTNDFDLKVRVSHLDPTDPVSKAGLIIRQNLTPGSPSLSAVVTPGPSPAVDGNGPGANQYLALNRATQGAATVSWGGVPPSPVPYTNAWVRVQRVGNTFKGFWANNGVDWIQFATNVQSYPFIVYVGLGATARNNNPGFTTRAVFEDFGIVRPPIIITDPESQNVNQGSLVTFSVEATGDPPLTYQWRKDSVDIPGATSSTYFITNAVEKDDGDYDVIVSNPNSSVFSLPGTLFVRLAPTITASPQSQAVSCGRVTFSVAAAGNPTLIYQWRKNLNPIPGANDNIYTIPSVSPNDAGTYSVLVSNDIASAISDDAILVVGPALQCLSPIVSSCTSSNGAEVSFNVTATDTCDPDPVVTCLPVSGATFPLGTSTVRCTAQNATGETNSCSFTVLVQDPVPAVLSISRNGAQAIISWPQSCTIYKLERKADLNPALPWLPTGQAVLVGANYQITVTIPPGPGSTFYRLQSP